MRAFIVSDVHGYYDELMNALSEKGFDINNEKHIFVSLGDLLDRGNKPNECLQFVNDLPANRKILIKGNHEYLMEDAINRKMFLAHDVHNGTKATVENVVNLPIQLSDKELLESMNKNELWNTYINSCIDYWENDKNIFVHGWIPCDCCSNGNLYTDFSMIDDWRNGDWKKACWMNGMEAWNQGVRIENKTIWCGHWHSSYGHSKLHKNGAEFMPDWIYVWNNLYPDSPIRENVNHTPFKDIGIVAMDASTAISGFINCKTINIKKEDIVWKQKLETKMKM